MSTTPHGVASGDANGITANVISAGMMASVGPNTKKNSDAVSGFVSSLMKFLMPSAIGCNNPNGPTRFGP